MLEAALRQIRWFMVLILVLCCVMLYHFGSISIDLLSIMILASVSLFYTSKEGVAETGIMVALKKIMEYCLVIMLICVVSIILAIMEGQYIFLIPYGIIFLLALLPCCIDPLSDDE